MWAISLPISSRMRSSGRLRGPGSCWLSAFRLRPVRALLARTGYKLPLDERHRAEAGFTVLPSCLGDASPITRDASAQPKSVRKDRAAALGCRAGSPTCFWPVFDHRKMARPPLYPSGDCFPLSLALERMGCIKEKPDRFSRVLCAGKHSPKPTRR